MPIEAKSKLVAIPTEFTKLYFNSKVWSRTSWHGIPVYKNPLDLWIYQEILCNTRPDVIIEGGTAQGGSALYLAHMCDIIGKGSVISIDIVPIPEINHNRIELMIGSTLDRSIIEAIKSRIIGKTVMVILDDDHSRSHVLKEMAIYGDLVTPGYYMIVEAGIIDQIRNDNTKGPSTAIKEFLESDKRFVADTQCEKFLSSFNPNGYLKRVS